MVYYLYNSTIIIYEMIIEPRKIKLSNYRIVKKSDQFCELSRYFNSIISNSTSFVNFLINARVAAFKNSILFPIGM